MLKEPNRPFTCIEQKKLEDLKQLALDYKRQLRKTNQPGGPRQTEGESTLSGFIDYDRLHQQFIQDRGRTERAVVGKRPKKARKDKDGTRDRLNAPSPEVSRPVRPVISGREDENKEKTVTIQPPKN